MKAIKNNLLPITSVCMLLLISVASVFISTVSGVDISRPLMSIVMGITMICGVSVVKEEYLHKAALIIYLAVIGVLCVQLLSGDEVDPVSMRYLYVFDMFALYTAALLPLTYLQSAKLIGKYKTIGIDKLLSILLVMYIPMILVFAQINMDPVVIAFLVFYITLIVMRKEKRIQIPWITFLVPIVLILLTIISICNETYFTSMKFETILTRGQNDPLGLGWVRTNLDGILMNTPFVGATHYSNEYLHIVEMLSDWGEHNIVVLLAEYGWLAFLTTLAIYVCFFVCLFKMVHTTRQSSFAKYTSLMFALSLLVQAVYSLVGLFLLDSSPVDMPFVSNGFTINIINYLSFGIVLSLYMGRNKPSKIKESEVEEKSHDYSLKGMIKSFKEDVSEVR